MNFPGLGLDPALAHLGLAVVEGEDPRGDAWRILCVLVEGRRAQQILAARLAFDLTTT